MKWCEGDDIGMNSWKVVCSVCKKSFFSYDEEFVNIPEHECKGGKIVKACLITEQ